MKSKLIIKYSKVIDEAKAKIDLFLQVYSETGVTCEDILLDNKEEDRSFNIDLENSTYDTLSRILRHYVLVKWPECDSLMKRATPISIHTSDVIGVYLLIKTTFGEFRLLVPIYKAFTHETIKAGKWNKALNGYEPLGSWDNLTYFGGQQKFFPRKEYSVETLLTQLKHLFPNGK